MRLIHGEGAGGGAAQAGERGKCAQFASKIIGKAADVCARRAVDGEGEAIGCVKCEHGDLVEVDGAGLDLYIFTAARLVVNAFAPLFERRVDGRRLELWSAQGRNGALDALVVQRGNRHGCGNRAEGVVGVGGVAEGDFGKVALGVALVVFNKACGASQTEDEQTAGHGVERAGMADAAFFGGAAHLLDHIMAGGEGARAWHWGVQCREGKAGFVHQEQPVHA